MRRPDLPRRYRIAMLTRGLALVCGLCLTTVARSTEPPAGITTTPQEGFNLLVRNLVSPTYAVLKLATPNHGWFAGAFSNLPIGQPVTLGLSMDGNDDEKTPANVAKWKGLKTVLTYSDPLQYDSYVGYTKDRNGHWVADDPFRAAADRDAGVGQAPVQQVIPPAVAAQFLSADGASWYPWREISQAHSLAGVNIFRMTETFTQSAATVAMRVPYPYQYLQALLERLRAANAAGVTIDDLGKTPDGHQLTVIRLEPPDPATAPTDRPTILAYAREHATEPEGSWVIEGMLRWLLSDDPAAKAARRQCDWLLIPLLDPDDAGRCRYTNADLFRNAPPVRPEAIAYAAYLVNRVDAGHRLELVINLHNIECTEGPNLFTPMVNQVRQQEIRAVNTALWADAAQAGFTTGQPAWSMVGMANARLSGWCFRVFRTLDLFYEVNGRAPASRLGPRDLQRLGRLLAQHAVRTLGSEPMTVPRADMKLHLTARHTARAARWQRTGRSETTRSTGDLLTYGY